MPHPRLRPTCESSRSTRQQGDANRANSSREAHRQTRIRTHINMAFDPARRGTSSTYTTPSHSAIAFTEFPDTKILSTQAAQEQYDRWRKDRPSDGEHATLSIPPNCQSDQSRYRGPATNVSWKLSVGELPEGEINHPHRRLATSSLIRHSGSSLTLCFK